MELDLREAFSIAVEVHGSQRDKAGEPYLFHVMRVAMAMDTDEERVVAILHDALEDAPFGHDKELYARIKESYGFALAHQVLEMAKGKKEPYMTYIGRLSSMRIPVKVKFADIQDNRNPDRLRKLPRAEADRLWDKYEEAWLALYAAADEAGTLPPIPALSPATAPPEKS